MRKRRKASTYRESVLQDVPELLGLSIAGIVNRQVTPLGDNLLRGEGSLRVSPSRVTPPLLDLLDLLGKEVIFNVRTHSRVDHIVRRHDCLLLFVLKRSQPLSFFLNGMMREAWNSLW
jgi:hypothetical protein